VACRRSAELFSLISLSLPSAFPRAWLQGPHCSKLAIFFLGENWGRVGNVFAIGRLIGHVKRVRHVEDYDD
jgi:hypothetical protein